MDAPRIVAARYRLVEELGRGGMGLVYAAHDERLGRTVALKTVLAHDAATRERIWREARAAASLSHPNVCQVYDLVEEDGRLFLAMELLEGEPLDARMARGVVPVEETLRIADGILAALAALHERGIVHRDLKPSNVFLTGHGVKVLDFGLALPLEAPDLRLTTPGTLVGTPRYMAPEQWRAEDVSAQTDLFAAGAVLFEMLAGRPAFPGEALGEICQAALALQPPALAGGPRVEAVDRVLRRALAKRAAERWPSAAAMAAALRAAVAPAHAEDPTQSGPLHARAITRLLVIPFRLQRPDVEIDFLSFGLADALTVALGSVPELVVRSSLHALRLGEGAPDLATIGAEADVDAVLFGTLLRAGDRVRLNTQLVQVPAGTVLGTATAEATLSDVFALEDELTRCVVRALALTLSPRDDRRLQEVAPASGRAYELYLRGNALRAGPRAAAELQRARDFYRAAIEADPRFAPAWARLGRTYRVMAKFRHAPADEMYRLAGEAFRRALELAPDLALAHNLFTYYELETPGGALAAMQRLLGQIAAGTRDPQLYAGLVVTLRYCGLLQASLAADREALRLDPHTSTSVHYTYWLLGELERAMARDDEDMPGIRVIALATLDRAEEALAVMRDTEARWGERHDLTWLRALRGALESDEKPVRQLVASIMTPAYRDPEGVYVSADLVALLRDRDTALAMLERAATGYWPLAHWETHPRWALLHGERRFERLVEQVRARHAEARSEFLALGGDRLLGLEPADGL